MSDIAQDLGGVVLLPCPFCGGNADTYFGNITKRHYVSCMTENCGMTGPDAHTYESAITAWNTRAHSAEIAGALRDAERWKPIETAPRDGRAMILAHMGGKPYIGKWCHDTWVDERGLSRGPSHWRPLPAPPTQDSAMQQGGGGGDG